MMEGNQSIEFTVDQDNRRISVKKTFLAPVEQVWNAWTQPEVLDQWWAPKPWKAVTKSLDFKEGGLWLYSMEGPKGEISWSKAQYKTINRLVSFEAVDTFCDENGNDDPAFPTLHWTVSFQGVENKTFVTTDIHFDNPSDLDKILEMGFKEGFIAGLSNLDEYFRQ